jgi:WD40 repeat protein
MNAYGDGHMTRFRLCLPILIALLAMTAHGQPGRNVTVEEVKALQAAYQTEHARVVKEGIAERFLPGLRDKAEEIAKKAEAALAAGRFLQAAEAYRQARWQLPYQPGTMPNHVRRVLGNLRLRHPQMITCVAYSPDGKLLATGSRDNTVKIWDLANGHELLTYTGHMDFLRAIVFSPDSKKIASGGGDKDIRVWDPRTGKDHVVLQGAGTATFAMVFAPDGATLIAGHDGGPEKAAGSLAFYDVASGKLLRSVNNFKNFVQTVAINAKGNIVAAGCGDGHVRLYAFPSITQSETQLEYWGYQSTRGATRFLAISPDDRTLLRCTPGYLDTDRMRTQLIPAEQARVGVELFSLVQPGSSFQASSPRGFIPYPKLSSPVVTNHLMAVFSHDGKKLFLGGSDGTIRIYDPEAGEELGALKGHTGAITGLAMHPDGIQLASTGSDYMVRLWDFDVVLQANEYSGHQAPVWTAQIAKNGQFVASAGADRTVKVWENGTGKLLHSLEGHEAAVTALVITPDSKSIISGGGDRVLKVWDPAQGKHIRDLDGHAATVTCLDVSADGKTLASGSADRVIILWDLAAGKQNRIISDLDSLVTSVAFAPDGNTIAVGCVDQSIRLIDVDTGAVKHRWSGHGVSVNGLTFTADGAGLVSCGGDHQVRYWPMKDPGQNPVTFVGHTGPVSSVACFKDTIVSCGADQTVRLWKNEDGTPRELRTFRGHRDWVTSVAFSKDGYFVVSASVDRTLRVWEITSRETPLLPEHMGAVFAVAFSPDGKKIASGGADKLIKVWDRTTGAELMTLSGHLDRIANLVFTPDSKGLISASGRFERSLRLWDLESGKETPLTPAQQRSWKSMIGAALLLSLTPQGDKLLMWRTGNDRYITILGFDRVSGEELFAFNDARPGIHSFSFAGNGKRAAVGASDGRVVVWDLDQKSPLSKEDWHFYKDDGGCGDIALTPAGDKLLVTNSKGHMTLADVNTRNVLKAWQGHEKSLLSVNISPDGKRIATFDEQNVVKLWDMDGKELRTWDLGRLYPGAGSFLANSTFAPDGKQLLIASANTTLFLLDLP